MKALVIFDSQFGNTEIIARAIGESLSDGAETTVVHAADVRDETLVGCDLLVVGSPTQAFHATKPVDSLLKDHNLKGIRAAAFDTRFDMAEVESRALRLAVKVAGESAAYAAPRIAAQLEKDGATVIVPPEAFYVEDTEGPLRAGELERAKAWGDQILAALR